MINWRRDLFIHTLRIARDLKRRGLDKDVRKFILASYRLGYSEAMKMK
jgi:hypothetical protein